MIIPAASKLQHLDEYYFSRKLAEIRKMNARGGDQVINLGVGSPDLGPDPEVIESLNASALKVENHGYQPYRGIPQLRQAMAEWYYRTYGVLVDPEVELLPLMGSKEGIFHISMAFLNPGDQVLVPNPGYPGYSGTSALVGAQPVCYPLDPHNDWSPDWKFLDNLDSTGIKLMWINYPHMPTGAIAKLDVFSRLMQWCIDRQILLCHDNPYSLILNADPPISLHQVDGAIEHALELNSLSKGHHMAGWRIGMVTGQRDYLDAIIKVKSNIDSGMFKGLQEGAITALQPRDAWHRQQNEIYRGRRELTWQLMDYLGCTYHPQSAGLFVWGKMSNSHSDTEAFTEEILQQARVFVVPGTVFGSLGEGYIRASLCVPEEKITQAINRIKEINITAT